MKVPPLFKGLDREDALRAMTAAFIVLLSRQPLMSFEVSVHEFQNFPYRDFTLTAHTDDTTNVSCFMLTAEHSVIS